jgi:hypothetical protein
MANYDWNWWFGPHSVIGRLFGVHSKPTPTPVPTPVPTPGPSATYRAVAVVTVPGASVTFNAGGNTFSGTTNGDGYLAFSPVLDGAAVAGSLQVKATGYENYSTSVTLLSGNRDLVVGDHGALAGYQMQLAGLVKVAPPAPKWTKAQLCDLQGDLMIFAPEIPGPAGVNTGAAKGLAAGYHWSVYLAWYTPENRQKLYAKVRDFYKWTHLAIQVCEQVPGSKGYHDLQDPMPAEFCDAYGSLMNTIHQEILDAGLVPVVAGPAPGPAAQGGANLAAGFDGTKVLVAMSDWDNTSYAAERIKFISDLFPNAWLFYERPGDPKRPSGIDKSPNVPVDKDWNITNGGQWLKNMASLCPRFVGVLYEVNNWPGDQGPDGCAAEIQQAHDGFWRDVQESLFETNTYDKFWQGRDLATYDALEVQLRAKLPFCKGYFSGGPAHPIVVEGPVIVGTGAGELDPNTVQWVAGGGNIGAYAQTTKITGINISKDGFECLFDKKSGAGRWPDNLTPGWDGPLQYSVGVCCKVNGQWVGAAPIESWFDHQPLGLGGPVTTQNVDNSGKGQFALNWFYNPTWGPLNGYNPKPGEVIGVFVAAGDCRNNFNPVKERSNIVLLALPGDGQSASFSF